jgi:hypothetical protein
MSVLNVRSNNSSSGLISRMKYPDARGVVMNKKRPTTPPCAGDDISMRQQTFHRVAKSGSRPPLSDKNAVDEEPWTSIQRTATDSELLAQRRKKDETRDWTNRGFGDDGAAPLGSLLEPGSASIESLRGSHNPVAQARRTSFLEQSFVIDMILLKEEGGGIGGVENRTGVENTVNYGTVEEDLLLDDLIKSFSAE